MLPYRIIRWTTEVYPVAVLFFYIGLFVLTFSVCFLMPPAAILLLLFSIFTLVPAVLCFRVLKAGELWLARDQIRRHRCPSCGEELQGSDETDCLMCGLAWEADASRLTA